MNSLDHHELRYEAKGNSLFDGKIITAGSAQIIDVVIHDRSAGGARLRISPATDLPDHFDVAIMAEHCRYPARICWRKLNELGIQFIGPPRRLDMIEVKKQQVVHLEAAAAAQTQTPGGAAFAKLVNYDKFKIHPEFTISYEENKLFSGRGTMLVEISLRNKGEIEAHQPFLCLPQLGLKLIAAPGWDEQVVTSVRKMCRFGRPVTSSLAPAAATHCCTMQLPFSSAGGGVLEYEAGNTHDLDNLPDLRLNCIAGAGNYPSERMPFFVPASEIRARVHQLSKTGRVPLRLAGIEPGTGSRLT